MSDAMSDPEETEREAIATLIQECFPTGAGGYSVIWEDCLPAADAILTARRLPESEKKMAAGVEYWRGLDYVPKMDRLNQPQHVGELAARRLSESGGVDLDAIRARADALSDFDGEEWQVWYSSATKEPVSVGPDNFTEQFRVDGMAEEDAVFVANAPQDVRELIAEVERLRLSESEIRRDQAEKDAGIVESIRDDETAPRWRAATLIRAQFTPSSEERPHYEIPVNGCDCGGCFGEIKPAAATPSPETEQETTNG